MGWAQIIYLVLVGLTCALSICQHGRARPPYDFRDSLINSAVALALLYWGGFFS